ncbi:hypothetical protein PC129_g25081 [Phytophthora cactorum]|uniref:Uncharacterized protein n=1 Tax=Phytophthora cactorum TaxID=29920 RepID=A0A8T1EU99_9STRA|nr:hypothetical protein PC114_g27338 [Phytophthora cactorum]KAG2956688.1 hypothetical protein PC119_g27591 [Phytophthora cactorum]KAG2958042.1 hypothetical protein PC118_g23722 [Phytophthora cactorum]KAG3115142.1 hypothetical protein C6341_g27666 [Phytophthora cactorum]KAG3191625.1 hypothetical protein PC129_g25081 [Phytophthora cactorum]
MYASPPAPSGMCADTPCPSDIIDYDVDLPPEVNGPGVPLSFEVLDVLITLGELMLMA